MMSSDGLNNFRIASRIAQMSICRMKSLLTNGYIPIHRRRKALVCFVEPILMCRCKTWTISNQLQKKLEGNRNVIPTENSMNFIDYKANQTKQCYEKLTPQDHS